MTKNKNNKKIKEVKNNKNDDNEYDYDYINDNNERNEKKKNNKGNNNNNNNNNSKKNNNNNKSKNKNKNKRNDDDDDDDNDGDDDDSIDDDGSEIGWNSDDEETYGHLFKNNKNKKSNQNEDSENDDDEENGDDNEDYDDDEGEGGMLLSDLLSSSKPTGTNPINNNDEDNEHDEHDEGDEDDDDEEEEEQYDFEPEDDDEDDNDDNPNHNKLLEAIEKYSKSTTDSNSTTKTKSKKNLLQLTAESPYSSTLQSGDQKVSLDSLINSLQSSDSNSQSIDKDTLKFVKNKLTEISKSLTAPKYVHKVQSDRAERGVAYQQSTEDMKKWQSIVAENKIAKTLDLRQDKRKLPSAKALVHNYKPQTDMEKEVQMILLGSSQKNEVDIEKSEEDELLQNKQLSLQEIKEKQAELAKVRSLLFYEQMKRHRINKIKSKTFHRILKKKKEKNQINKREYDEMLKKLKANGDIFDDDIVEDDNENNNGNGKETEEEMMKRIKERMSLRHKNTGKWARMALEHGKGSKSLRDAYHEAVLLGNELTKKANKIGEDDNNDPYEGSIRRPRTDNDNDNNNEGNQRSSKKLKIIDEAAENLEGVLESNKEIENIDGKYKALFEMDFMKKAREQQQMKAKEEAQRLLREIEEMEEGLDSDSDNDDDGGNNGNNNKNGNNGNKEDKGKGNHKSKEENQKNKEKLELARKQMSSLMNGNKSMNLTGQIEGNSVTTIATTVTKPNTSTLIEDNPWLDASHHNNKSRDINTIIGTSNDNKKQKQKNSVVKEQKNSEVVIKTETDNTPKNKNKNTPVNNNNHNTNNNNTNNTATIKKTDNKNSDKQQKSKSTTKTPSIENSVNTISITESTNTNTSTNINNTKNNKKAKQIEVKTETKSEPTRKPLLSQKSQQDLVNLAFAGPDLEAEFEALKEKTIDEELNINDKKRKILSEEKAGWGDWAGPGMTGVSQKIVKKRQRLLRNLDEKKAELKAGRTDSTLANVIVSEKRVRTSAKYRLAEVPHPFTTREEYERSIQMPVGNEWNAEHIVRKNTKPEILLRAGRIIEPIKLPKQKQHEHQKQQKK